MITKLPLPAASSALRMLMTPLLLMCTAFLPFHDDAEAASGRKGFDVQSASFVLQRTTNADVARLARRIIDESAYVANPMTRQFRGNSASRGMSPEQKGLLRALRIQEQSQLDRTFLSAIIVSRSAALAELGTRNLRAAVSRTGDKQSRAIIILQDQLAMAQLAQSQLADNSTVTSSTLAGATTTGTQGNLVLLGSDEADMTSDGFPLALAGDLVNGQPISSVALNDGSILSCLCPGQATTTSSGGSGIRPAILSPTSAGTPQPISSPATGADVSSGSGTTAAGITSASAVGQNLDTAFTSATGAVATPGGTLGLTGSEQSLPLSTPSTFQIIESPTGFTDVRPGGFIGIPSGGPLP